MTGEPDRPLVSAAWVNDRLDRFQDDDSEYRLVEVDIETDRYSDAHIPGAVRFDWRGDLQDTSAFDVVDPSTLGDLLGNAGIDRETTIVLYGDFYNWFAAHAFWLLRYYRHENLLLLDGGRKYWLDQAYPTTTETPSFTPRSYEVPSPDESIRADRDGVEDALEADTHLVDVRAPPEYHGDILSPPGWNEGVQRGGHIPGAVNIPWSRAVRHDGRLKPRDELETIYDGVHATDRETILYCRIGERSAFTWVVLAELLGVENVAHYYGSWVEWGNTVGLPIADGSSGDLK